MEDFIRNSSTPNRLKEAMYLRGKKQIDLVNETGINRSAISRYLSGEYEPKQIAIYKLAKALNVSEMWLWGYDVPMERTTEQKSNDIIVDIIARLRTDDDFLSTVQTLYDLDKEKLRSVQQMLSAFTK